MSKSNGFETSFLQHIFNNSAIANIGDATGLPAAATAGSLYVSLHTNDPGETLNSQATNETAYTNYARIAVARSAAGWTVSGNTVSNTAAINFATCGATGATLLYWGIGTALSGAGTLLFKGPLSAAAQGMALGESTDDTMTIKNHALAVDDRVAFFAMGNLSLPTGVNEGTVYFVKSVPSVDTITLATTSGGTTVDITADGQGMAFKIIPFSVTSGITPSFGIGALQIIED
jgi:hypothetical protein